MAGPEQSAAPNFGRLAGTGRKELWAALGLRHCRGLGSRRVARLLREFGGAYAAIRAATDPAQWKRAGIGPEIAAQAAGDSWRDKARPEWERLRGADCGLLLWTDAAYPHVLRQLPDAPPFLYCRGDLALLRAPAVAVVGSRLCTEQGRLIARQIAQDLSLRGVTVISGLARGIDQAAHLGALRGIGSSIAVLGAGIDVPYPSASGDVRSGLEERGLILSEYGPGVQPKPGFFPVRNRLISGLALAVVVIEASRRSGSLITARLALEQGRDVCAVPGPALAPSSFGCHELVRQGARPVFSAEDVLTGLTGELSGYVMPELPRTGGANVPVEAETGQAPVPRNSAANEAADTGRSAGAERVLAFLRQKPDAHIDDICRGCGLSAPEASSCALRLELAGHICQLPGLRYRLT